MRTSIEIVASDQDHSYSDSRTSGFYPEAPALAQRTGVQSETGQLRFSVSVHLRDRRPSRSYRSTPSHEKELSLGSSRLSSKAGNSAQETRDYSMNNYVLFWLPLRINQE